MKPAGSTTDGSIPSRREALAGMLCAIGLASLPALATVVPKGYVPFAFFLALSTCMAPNVLVRRVREIAVPFWIITATIAAVVVVLLFSIWHFGLSIDELQHHSRLVAIPWCMIWVYALNGDKRWLWAGALFGILATSALLFYETSRSIERAAGWNSNAIVFADTFMVVIVMAMLCAPRRFEIPTLMIALLGMLAISFTGTRSVWPGLLIAMALMILRLRSGGRRSRWILLIAILAAMAAAVISMPGLKQHVRIGELRRDLSFYEQGNLDTSSGARAERLLVAYRTLIKHPMAGVGVGQFDRVAMKAEVPACRDNELKRCGFGHAHNDLAEWSATMGVPGGLALSAIYLVPFVLMAYCWWRTPGRRNDAAIAGMVSMAALAICGMTQSMFAHQSTASILSAVAGLMLGLSLGEMRQAQARASASLGE
ncbi:MAG: O-antigen ligase family protein [Xanthomonadaceae bacterium]|jgi:O-antigen ligase|nr:O-antigen ligase family protein [Xanthomonadaceae bacterium]